MTCINTKVITRPGLSILYFTGVELEGWRCKVSSYVVTFMTLKISREVFAMKKKEEFVQLQNWGEKE